MRILHVGFSSYYTDGMLYQDNYLVKYNLLDNYETTYITSNYCYKNGVLINVSEEDILLNNGARIIRLKYDNVFNSYISKKIQKVTKFYNLLIEFKPDIILYHGISGYELMNVAKYVKNNPETIFYIDSHADFYNTAKNYISKLFYKYIHGFFLKKALPYAKKILPITYESQYYLKKMYNVSDEKMEIFPLGGEIISLEKQQKERLKLIKQYNLRADSIIFAHSGKLDKFKCTKELIEAFKQVNDERIVLFIFGSIPDEQKDILIPLINSDRRINFIGWKINEEITDILAATDIYCQPGTYSTTFQTALCAGCTAIAYPYKTYKIIAEDSILFCERNVDSIYNIIKEICNDNTIIDRLKVKAYKIANEKLNYKVLSRRYLA